MGQYTKDKKYYMPDIIFPEFNKNGSVDITLTKEEFEVCDYESHRRWSNTKSGIYGSGMINSIQDPCRAERIGLYGEMAYAKIFADKVDCVYRWLGDKQDFILFDNKVDVKCASNDRQVGLIYYINPEGKYIHLDKDIYVFGNLLEENLIEKRCKVQLFGWCLFDDIKSRNEVRPARFKASPHFNLEMPYSLLNSIYTLHSLYACINKYDTEVKQYEFGL